MKFRSLFAIAILLCGMTALTVRLPGAQAALPSMDVGIALGKKVPVSMPLKDSAGKPTTLAQQVGAKGLVLMLVRSANWCPYCKAQLIALNAVRADVAQRGYRLASLSYDKPETLSGFAKAKGLGFTLLSDVGSKMIDALGLRDPQYASVPFANGVPRATILILGRDGTVKAKNVSSDYTIRPSNADLLAMIDRLGGR